MTSRTNLISLLTTATILISALQLRAEPLRTTIFDPNFRTLRVEDPNDFMRLPVIRLGSNDVVRFSFDEIADDFSLLEYRVIHCNSDWTPSALLETEYLPRFNSAKVEDYAFSSNTYIHFINYQITIPNEEIAPLISGNYILQVYPESDPDNVLLQARFLISEDIAQLLGDASAKTDCGVNTDAQQLSFRISAPNIEIRDPFSEIIAVVEQNNDPASTRTLTHPSRMEGSDIVYDHLAELIFPAGNEFRRFETVRADYPGMHIDSVRYEGNNYQAWLSIDKPRTFSEYSYDSTQHGRFLIREYNATDSDLAADYITTHFALDMPQVREADIYLYGDFTHHTLAPQFKMYYDIEARKYLASVPLKQGSYNYEYVLVPKGQKQPASPNPIEGDKYETLNEYSVKIYYRTPGARADRLITTGQFISTP